ncbi:MAG: endonuclease III [Bdellovibrionales bacterium]
MAESANDKKLRTKTIIQRLKRYYPDAHCALDHTNPLELLMATILSAQCTDERVNIVTKTLFAKYRTAKDYAEAPAEEIEDIIKSTGFYRAKAKSLKGTGKIIAEEFHGEVPRKMEELRRLPGVGRKTANVVLGNAFNITSGIVVDTHVKRLAYRLGQTNQKMPEKVETDLDKLVPRKDWIIYSHLLISHGRKICKAQRPLCEKCVLEGLCPKRGVKLKRIR